MKKTTETIWQLVVLAYLFGHLLLQGCSQTMLTAMGCVGCAVAVGCVCMAANYHRQSKEQRFWAAVLVTICVALVAAWDIYRAV